MYIYIYISYLPISFSLSDAQTHVESCTRTPTHILNLVSHTFPLLHTIFLACAPTNTNIRTHFLSDTYKLSHFQTSAVPLSLALSFTHARTLSLSLFPFLFLFRSFPFLSLSFPPSLVRAHCFSPPFFYSFSLAFVHFSLFLSRPLSLSFSLSPSLSLFLSS